MAADGQAGDPKPAASTASTGKTSAAKDDGTLQALQKDMMLGEFRVLRRLGRGGMAEVYLAEQTSLKRSVAVKVLRPNALADASYLPRFQTEAHAAAGLNHSNIVQVYTVGEDHGVHYIAQEYVQGQNLREFLVRKGPPDLPVAMLILRQTASALQAAHEAGIVHRDIKPENIMLTKKGEVKVADFGLAKINAPNQPVNLTQVGMTMGTPLYMSPEQVTGNKLDHRTDLYSFGVTAYHMLAGEPPFRGATALSVAMKHVKEEAEPLEKLRPDLPPMLCKIVHKLMAKSLDERYSSAAAVLKDLKRLGQELKRGESGDGEPAAEAVVAAAQEAPPVAERSVPQWLRPLDRLAKLTDAAPRRQVPLLIAGMLVLAGLGAGTGYLTRPHVALPQRGAQGAGVDHQGSAAAQFELAKNLKTDLAAWQAVIQYYPNDSFYRPQAELELALLALANEDVEQAERYFKELRAYSDFEPQWRAAGLAGQAIILSRQGDARARDILRALAPQADLLDPRLRKQVEDILQRNAGAREGG